MCRATLPCQSLDSSHLDDAQSGARFAQRPAHPTLPPPYRIAKKEGISLEQLHIQPDHVHCLFSLPSHKTIAFIGKALKGESSRWINQQGLLPGRFRWQRGYGALSVSASQIDPVKRYIENQEEHHKRQTFQEEYDEWKRRYGLEE